MSWARPGRGGDSAGPRDEFEAAVEGDDLPPVADLARRGGRAPADFKKATRGFGLPRHFTRGIEVET